MNSFRFAMASPDNATQERRLRFSIPDRGARRAAPFIYPGIEAINSGGTRAEPFDGQVGLRRTNFATAFLLYTFIPIIE